MSSAGEVAVPGQRLATADGKLKAGNGAYMRDWRISQDVVEVTRTNKTVASAQVLRLGDIITSRQVMVDILCVGETVLKEAFPGTIRLEDVRNHDIDKLVMEEVFSPPTQQDSQTTDMETD
ncbi:Nucleic acid-binding, OB-fold [Phytophthora cactorum]|nr:Nucleic acid-binding, OB-fold [Phytophthora cactorum]